MDHPLLYAALSGSSIGLAAGPAVAADVADLPPIHSVRLPEVAASTPAGRFGTRSQVAISSDAGLSIANTSQTRHAGSTTTLELRPAVDYFVADDWSMGGFVGIAYTRNPGGHSTTFSLGPRLGYNIPLSPRLSVWPKAGLSFASTTQAVDARNVVLPDGTILHTTNSSTTSSNLALNLFAPLMLHPAEHFFLGFGPALDVDLTGDVKTVTVAGRLSIGGWL